MELLYTGASEFEGVQIEPSKSLGGYLSSSPVPNDFFSNLFGEITKKTISGSPQYICLGITTDVDIENISFTMITTKNNQGRFRVAATIAEQNNCNEFVFPEMQNVYSKPVNLPFSDCTSFWGENKIEFSVQPQDGEIIEIYSGGNLIAELTYDTTLENFFIYPAYVDQFELEVRWDAVNKTRTLHLTQKDLINFDPAIEVIRALDSQDIGVITNQLPSINAVGLGTLTSSQALAVYIERSVSNETVKENIVKNNQINCEKKFDEYEAGFSPNTVEKIELEVEYDETVAP